MQNACHPRTWNLFDCPGACWQPFHICCGSQSGEDAFQLPEAEAQVPCLTWISWLSAPFSNRWMDRQPPNHNTKRDRISGFVSGNYISLQISVSQGAAARFFHLICLNLDQFVAITHRTAGPQQLDLDCSASSGFNSKSNLIAIIQRFQYLRKQYVSH